MREQALEVPASDSQVYTLTRAFWRQVPFCFPNWVALIVAISGQEGVWRNISGREGLYCALCSLPLRGSSRLTEVGWQAELPSQSSRDSGCLQKMISETWAAPLVTLTPMTVTSGKKFWLGECGLRERTQHWRQSAFKFQFTAHTGKFRACFLIFKMQWWPKKKKKKFFNK